MAAKCRFQGIISILSRKRVLISHSRSLFTRVPHSHSFFTSVPHSPLLVHERSAFPLLFHESPAFPSPFSRESRIPNFCHRYKLIPNIIFWIPIRQLRPKFGESCFSVSNQIPYPVDVFWIPHCILVLFVGNTTNSFPETAVRFLSAKALVRRLETQK